MGMGAWTFDGGGGAIVNSAPGMYNASFGGLLAQYTFSPLDAWCRGVSAKCTGCGPTRPDLS
jgi:hypothetical protein